MKVFIFSNPGNNPERSLNEDAVLASVIYSRQNLDSPLSSTLPSEPILVAVADGMGGRPGGQEAAEIVLQWLRSLNCQTLCEKSEAEVIAKLNQALDMLTDQVAHDPRLKGLGATVAGLWLDNSDVLVFNCGDCRVYRVRDGFLDQISRDHSRVYQLYMAGAITYEEIRIHPMKHLVSSSIQEGTEPPEIFQKRLPLRFGDAFLICCDGVWEALSLEEMEECLKDKPIEAGAESLVATLMQADCQDNISFLLFQPDEE